MRVYLLELWAVLLFLTWGSWFVMADDEELWRTWTSTAGTSIEAKVVRVGATDVTLERRDGVKFTVGWEQLSADDQKLLAELSLESLKSRLVSETKGNTSIESLGATAGEISGPILCAANSEASYFLYLPVGFHDGREWAVCFVMAAGGGKSSKSLDRYTAIADRLGIVLALSVESKNGFAGSDAAMRSMVDDVFERVPVIEGLGMSTGMSGGGRMAYLLAEGDNRIEGVLPCGAGGGVYIEAKDFRQAVLRNSTYVYSLVGTNCFNRTGAYQTHQKLPEDCRLRFFPGKHTWAKGPILDQGVARVLGALLEGAEHETALALRQGYMLTMLEMAGDMVEAEPWEAAYWAKYLESFPSGNQVLTERASQLRQQVESDPRVGLAQQAERAIEQHAGSFFEVFYTEDKKENPARKAAAEKAAEPFSSIPHGELILLLGEKC